jgi:NifU-like protein involved in Fe-S cluster formation
MAELDRLYSEKIIEIAANPPNAPRLATPQASARKVSRICGSAIEVDIVIEDGVFVGYGHAVSACALGQTSAAIVAARIVGTAVPDFLALRAAMHAMLKEEGAAPAGHWAELGYLEPVRDYPNRHASTLLVFDAVAAALEKIESGEAVGA